MNEIKLFCPASVANVSCGFDILGICLENVGDEMIIRKTNNPGVKITKIKGDNLPFENKKNVAGISAMTLVKEKNIPFGFEIEIYKGIASGSGIGSSAASSAGAVFGINKLLGSPFTKNELIKFAMEGEKLASGTLHADNVAPIILGGFTLIRCSKTLDIINLPTPKDLFITIVHPKIELKTSDSRSVLKQKVPLQKTIQQSANLASLVSGLYTNDYKLISRSLVDVIIEPSRSALIPAFDELKYAAKKKGSLGSGISGSGPSMFALSKGEKIAKNVSAEMGKVLEPLDVEYETFISKINTEGIKIIS